MVAGKSENSRSVILQLLAVDRLSELDVHARVALLDALMKLRLSAHPRSQAYVKNIITSTMGEELTLLKCLMDLKGTSNNLHKLVYWDISSTEIREQILNHIKAQVSCVRVGLVL